MSSRIQSPTQSRMPRTTGRVLLKLNECHCSAPAHLDVIHGSARPLNHIDAGGAIDRCVHSHTAAMRVRRVFSARQNLHRPGEMGEGFAMDEIDQGLDRVIALELANPLAAVSLSKDLMEKNGVEWAMPEPLSFVPLDVFNAASSLSILPTINDIRKPHEAVNAFAALALEPGDSGIIISAIDTGIAMEHAEFSGRIYGGLDTVDLGMGLIGGDVELVGDSRGRDFCARDETGHGSHVAGIMSAKGIQIPAGLAGAAMLAPVRALAAARTPNGQVVGIGGTLDIEAAIKAAADLGARVLNLSFGTSQEELHEGVATVHAESVGYATSMGAVCVAAMGNSGRPETYFPAALPDVIAVGAITDDGHRADFSTSGEHITLSAPGEEIVSVGLDGYRRSTGTSHAAPFVSGTVALMLSFAQRCGVSLTPRECKEILITSASPGAVNAPRNEIGAGLLDAEGALHLTKKYISDKKGSLHAS